MNSAVCTLFEGDYHLGLGALVNSLISNGFTGCIWAGYRGDLPPWALVGVQSKKFYEYRVVENCFIRFVRLDTETHFTNYKPDFMLRILDDLDPKCEALFYVDPDIVVCENWIRFEEWVSCGVALCEDVNSPIALGHPSRIGWRHFYREHNYHLKPREIFYANGGFVGITRNNRDFLVNWKSLQDLMCDFIGGAHISSLSTVNSVVGRDGFFGCFGKTDQDALNAAIELSQAISVSFLSRQAMGFQAGKSILPHAVGPLKPWKKSYLRSALLGSGCTVADKQYWKSADGPIKLYPQRFLKQRRLSLKVAAAFGRFVRRT